MHALARSVIGSQFVGETGVGQNLARLAIVVLMDQDPPRQHAERAFDDAHVLVQHQMMDIGAVEQRADGIAEVLAALDRGFGSLAILAVHGDPKTPANRVLVRATKGGRAPAQILPALMLNDESGVPNKEVQEVLAGKRGLPLAAL